MPVPTPALCTVLQRELWTLVFVLFLVLLVLFFLPSLLQDMQDRSEMERAGPRLAIWILGKREAGTDTRV